MPDSVTSETKKLEKNAFRVNEAAHYCAISRTSLYELLKSGKLASTKVAGRRLILRRDLDRLLEGGEC